MASTEDLPDEILQEIFIYLVHQMALNDARMALHSLCVSRRWRRISSGVASMESKLRDINVAVPIRIIFVFNEGVFWNKYKVLKDTKHSSSLTKCDEHTIAINHENYEILRTSDHLLLYNANEALLYDSSLEFIRCSWPKNTPNMGRDKYKRYIKNTSIGVLFCMQNRYRECFVLLSEQSKIIHDAYPEIDIKHHLKYYSDVTYDYLICPVESGNRITELKTGRIHSISTAEIFNHYINSSSKQRIAVTMMSRLTKRGIMETMIYDLINKRVTKQFPSDILHSTDDAVVLKDCLYHLTSDSTINLLIDFKLILSVYKEHGTYHFICSS